MPGSTNTHTQNYISRVLSFKGNEIQTNNNRKINYKRLNEELRQHIGKLKGELEMEKTRSKQTHRDKVMEMKRIRDEFDLKYQLSLEEANAKFNNTKDAEMKKLREILAKEKEQEIKQIIKFKDEEIKILQKTFAAEKERAIKDFELKLTSASSIRSRTSSIDTSEKLKLELADLQNHKDSLERKCKEFSQMLTEKNNFIEEMKGKHNREIQRILREARRESSRSISDLNKIKKDLDQKNSEMIKLEYFVKKVSEEKEQLLEKIRKGRITSQHGRHAFSLSNLNDPDALIDKEELSLIEPNQLIYDFYKRVIFEKQWNVMDIDKQPDEYFGDMQWYAANNLSIHIREDETKPIHRALKQKIKKTCEPPGSLKSDSAAEKKMKDLKRRNTELVMIARKLEEKIRQTEKKYNELKTHSHDMAVDSALKNSKGDMKKLKTSFAIQRAKDKAEHAQSALMKEKQLKEMGDRYKEAENALQLAERERLRLEKQVSISPNPSEFQNIQVEVNELRDKNQSITSQYEELRLSHSSCSTTTKELEEKVKLIETLKNEMKAKEEECTALSTSLTKKEGDMNHLQKLLKEKEYQCSLMIKDNDIHTSHIKELERVIKEMKVNMENIEKLRGERDTLEMQIIETKEIQKTMAEKIQELELEIKELKKTLSHERKEYSKLDDEYTEVSSKLFERDQEIQRLHELQRELTNTSNNRISTLEDNLRNAFATSDELSTQNRKLTEQMKEQQRIYEKRNRDAVSVNTQTNSAQLIDAGIQVDLTKQLKIRDNAITPDSNEFLDVLSARIDQLAVSYSEPESTAESIDPTSNRKKEKICVQETFVTKVSVNKEESGLDDVFYEDTDEKVKLQKTLDELFQRLQVSPTNPIRLFQARHTYDPLLFSPNRDHELELPLTKGDYLYVYGSLDENGFYLAELKNGKRGLVPNNYIEEVEGNNITGGDFGSDENLSENTKTLNEYKLNPKDHVEYMKAKKKYVGTVRETVASSQALSCSSPLPLNFTDDHTVPPPVSLRVDRQLNSSLVVAWIPPANVNPNNIKGYTVYVNEKLQQTILGVTRRKALISDVHPDGIYRISLCTVQNDDQESDRYKSSITLGKNVSMAPYDLKVKDISATSAVLMWKPSDSKLYHAVYLNGNMIIVLYPGSYIHSLTELNPSTNYIVKIEARKSPNKALSDMPSVESRFQTQANEIPDAPINFDCTVKEGTVLAKWIPVTIKECGTSNGSLITGYRLYTDNALVVVAPNPFQSSIEIPFSQLEKYFCDNEFILLYVRTQSHGGESALSNPAKIYLADINPYFNGNKSNIENGNKSNTSIVYNPENDINFFPSTKPIAERIVISDDELSVIMEESEEESSRSNSLSARSNSTSDRLKPVILNGWEDLNSKRESDVRNLKNNANFGLISHGMNEETGIFKGNRNVDSPNDNFQCDDMTHSKSDPDMSLSLAENNTVQNDMLSVFKESHKILDSERSNNYTENSQAHAEVTDNTLSLQPTIINAMTASNQILKPQSDVTVNSSSVDMEKYLTAPADLNATKHLAVSDNTLDKIESVPIDIYDSESTENRVEPTNSKNGREPVLEEILNAKQEEKNENVCVENALLPIISTKEEGEVLNSLALEDIEQKVSGVSSELDSSVKDYQLFSVNALTESLDNSYPMTDSIENSIETSRYLPLNEEEKNELYENIEGNRKEDEKEFLKSSKLAYKLTTPNTSLIEQNTYTINKNSLSPLDENHNKTYSLHTHTDQTSLANKTSASDQTSLTDKTSETDATANKYKDSCEVINPANTFLDLPAKNNSNNIQSISTSQIDSMEIINMIERDAHRDILDDYPELPIDEQVDHVTYDPNKTHTLFINPFLTEKKKDEADGELVNITASLKSADIIPKNSESPTTIPSKDSRLDLGKSDSKSHRDANQTSDPDLDFEIIAVSTRNTPSKASFPSNDSSSNNSPIFTKIPAQSRGNLLDKYDQSKKDSPEVLSCDESIDDDSIEVSEFQLSSMKFSSLSSNEKSNNLLFSESEEQSTEARSEVEKILNICENIPAFKDTNSAKDETYTRDQLNQKPGTPNSNLRSNDNSASLLVLSNGNPDTLLDISNDESVKPRKSPLPNVENLHSVEQAENWYDQNFINLNDAYVKNESENTGLKEDLKSIADKNGVLNKTEIGDDAVNESEDISDDSDKIDLKPHLSKPVKDLYSFSTILSDSEKDNDILSDDESDADKLLESSQDEFDYSITPLNDVTNSSVKNERKASEETLNFNQDSISENLNILNQQGEVTVNEGIDFSRNPFLKNTLQGKQDDKIEEHSNYDSDLSEHHENNLIIKKSEISEETENSESSSSKIPADYFIAHPNNRTNYTPSENSEKTKSEKLELKKSETEFSDSVESNNGKLARIFMAVYTYDPSMMSPNIGYADDELAFQSGALIKVYGDIDEDGFYFGELNGRTGLIPSNLIQEVETLEEPSESAIQRNTKFSKTKPDSSGCSALANPHNASNVNHISNDVKQTDSAINNSDSFDTALEKSLNLVNKMKYAESTHLFQVGAVSQSMNNLSNQDSGSQLLFSEQAQANELDKRSVSMPDMPNEVSKPDPYKLVPKRVIALFDYDPTLNSPNVDCEIELGFTAGEVIDIYGDMDEDGFFAGKINNRKGLVPSNFVRDISEQEEPGADVNDSPKLKKRSSIFKKSKKIFSKLKKK